MRGGRERRMRGGEGRGEWLGEGWVDGRRWSGRMGE